MSQQTLILVIVIVAVAMLGLGVFLGRGFGVPLPEAEPTPEMLPEETLIPFTPTPLTAAPVPTTAVTGPPRPTVDTNRVIQEAINAGDANTLKTHMAETVTYAISATECCGNLPRGEALAQLTRRTKGKQFDFSPTNPSVATIRTQATGLTGFTIGVGGMDVLAYRLNPALKLDGISEADVREFGITP